MEINNKGKKILACAYLCLLKDKNGGSGGEAILGWNIVRQISRFNKVWVLTHEDGKEDIEYLTSKMPNQNVIFCYVGLPKFLNFLQSFFGGLQFYIYLWQIKAYFVAKKLHKKNNFDIFHHITFANDWMASFIGALLPIPYIRGPGGGAHKVPKSFLSSFSFKDQLSQYSRSFAQWIFRHDLFFILGQSRAKALLVCNLESFNAIPNKWRKKAQVFPVNGASLEDINFLKGTEKKINKKFTILTAGRFIRIKGFDFVIKSFKSFSDKIPDSQLIIIGGGPELNNLKKIEKNNNLETKIIFTGWTSRENLLQEMADCDVFLFLSLRDGGGQVVVEAMAAGKPIVCFDIAGPGFHVDKTCGIKINPGNPGQAVADVAKALENLYFNKELRDALGLGARIKAEEKYDWNKLGDRLNEIYIDMLNRKGTL